MSLFVIKPLFTSGEGGTGVAVRPNGELAVGLRKSVARVDPTSGDRAGAAGDMGLL